MRPALKDCLGLVDFEGRSLSDLLLFNLVLLQVLIEFRSSTHLLSTRSQHFLPLQTQARTPILRNFSEALSSLFLVLRER